MMVVEITQRLFEGGNDPLIIRYLFGWSILQARRTALSSSYHIPSSFTH